MGDKVLSRVKAFKRKVRFIRWGKEIEKVSFQTLVFRNIKKFLKEGTLITLTSLYELYQEVSDIPDQDFKYHSNFAELSGYFMDDEGRLFDNLEVARKYR